MIHFFEFEKNSRNTDSNNSNKSHIQTKIAKILNLHMLAKGQIGSYSVADMLYVTECKHTKKQLNSLLHAGFYKKIKKCDVDCRRLSMRNFLFKNFSKFTTDTY